MKHARTAISLACLAALLSVAAAMPPFQCNPGYVDDVPPRIRKICVALSTLYELGSAMENYVNDKVPVTHEGNLLLDNGVKRQDVDHVFLRFGKRSLADASDGLDRLKIPLHGIVA
ncbi:myosuppressin [Phymastichus coffea]|uniref:myosuppressin n=1 Tax=Phymastichus coffea TaxID=108790 RepID=UPI00273C05A5|nr:myosuppressin [Phymastichus coffea]